MVYGKIYLVTNLVNGKVYVGQTVRSISERWQGHCKPSKACKSALSAAIKKYGQDQFTCVELAIAADQVELDSLEVRFITEHRSHVKEHGYNLTLGGGGVVCNEDTRDKFRQANGGSRNHQFGTKMSQAKKDLLQAARRANPMPPGAKRRKHTKHFSADGLKNIGAAARKTKTGKSRSQDLKDKLRAANQGSNNPSYGRRWMFHPETSQVQKVAGSSVASLIDQGWKPGRK